MRRVAAIDLGTNSVRLIVAEVERGEHRVVDEEKAQVRLGEGLAASGRLSEEAQARTIEAILRLLAIARDGGATTIRVVATHAVRSASNGAEFARRVKRETGVEPEVISAEEEARLAFIGAAANFGLPGRAAVVDIGGGSVEIVRSTDGEIESITSLPLGVVVLADQLPGSEDPPSSGALKRLRKHIRASLVHAFGPDPGSVGFIVGSGGTVTSLGAMVAAQHGEDFNSVQGREVAAADVVHTYAYLRGLTLEQRRRVPGLPPYRADIAIPGTLLLREIMRLFDTNRLLVNTKGLREGLLLDTLAHAGKSRRNADRRASLLEFARRCRADERHAEQVAALSLELFDQVADPTLGETHRALLEAAALVHDVGYFIAYRSHHKHSCHLIAHADLPGFTPREVATIAAIARYHRGAMPKMKHEEFARLPAEERDPVMKLAGILKLADGLDRGRAGRIASVRLERDGDSVRLAFDTRADPHVEVYGAREKADLFERVFGVRLEIDEG